MSDFMVVGIAAVLSATLVGAVRFYAVPQCGHGSPH